MNTVENICKASCTGCGACFNICPNDAITMEYDEEGFAYPNIRRDICTDCGLCYERCPSVKAVKLSEQPECFAVMAEDEIRLKSSSGGMFTLLAEKVIDSGGYVCGAAYSADYSRVDHIVVSDKEGLEKLRGSKYVQSDTGNVYRQIKKLLDEEKNVLFSGCPCQAAGLKNFLEKEYDNLLIIDLICHGANSLKAYKSFLKECAGERTVKSVNFREKEGFGWSTPVCITYTDGTQTRQSCDKSPWYKGFLRGVINRPYCGNCVYAAPLRVGDITLGDFWGVSDISPEYNDEKGTGLVLINTSKGEKAFFDVKQQLKLCQPVIIDKVKEIARTRNGQLLSPQKAHANRKRFFDEIDNLSFSSAVDYSLDEHYDIGVVGWWYNENYGGTLTYYALNRVLRSMGLSVLMIEKPCLEDSEAPNYENIPRRFAKKHYAISKIYHPNKLGEINAKCTAFISGSDQLFAPSLWSYSGPSLYLDFVNPGKNIISFASSFGESFKSGDDFRSMVSYYLHRFNSISVREDYAVDIMRDRFGLEAEKVLDPVFVCDPSEFYRLADSSHVKIEKEYFASFFLDPCAEKRDAILYTKKKLGLPYVNLIHACDFESNIERLGLDETKSDLDVEDFLNYYRNAKFIITDSFHGTCMAIIFRKPFISIANRQRGVKRFVSMLNEVGLSNRLVFDYSEIYRRSRLYSNIDYDKVYKRINLLREKSYNWLKRAIFEPQNKAAVPFNVMDIKQYEMVLKILSLQETVYKQQQEINELKEEIKNIKK